MWCATRVVAPRPGSSPPATWPAGTTSAWASTSGSSTGPTPPSRATPPRRALLHGDAAAPYTPVPYFWSDQHGTKIQFVGHSHPGDAVRVVEGSVAERRFVAAYGRNGRLTAALLWNRAARIPHWLDQLTAGAPFPPNG